MPKESFSIKEITFQTTISSVKITKQNDYNYTSCIMCILGIIVTA